LVRFWGGSIIRGGCKEQKIDSSMTERVNCGRSVRNVQILSVIAIAFASSSLMYPGLHDGAHFPQISKSFVGTGSTVLKTPIGIDEIERATRRHFENSTERTALEPVPRPSIEDLADGPKVTGDVAWLLQFAVLGFPKCGTSFMMRYLGQHDEIAMLTDREHCELTTGTKDSVLVKALLDGLPIGNYARGLKCPKHLERPLAMDRLFRYFPNVRVIVGVRHPVLWFESFYNYRHLEGHHLLPAQELIGNCWNLGPTEKVRSVCTERAKFHNHLARLGKTSMQSAEERQHFSADVQNVSYAHGFSSTKVFLYDMAQLDDKNQDRSDILLEDLRSFLRVTKPFPPMVEEPKAVSNATRIDICDVEYDHLREVLLDTGVKASRWIRRVFVHAEGVTVSSPDFLDQLLAKWEEDPCEERRAKSNASLSRPDRTT
jgi:hypothetical protein